MGWIIFAIMMIFGFMASLPLYVDPKMDMDEYPLFCKICLGISVGCAALLVLYVIGWVWYFLGGFLVFEDLPFWDRVLYGLMALLPLGVILVTIKQIARGE